MMETYGNNGIIVGLPGVGDSKNESERGNPLLPSKALSVEYKNLCAALPKLLPAVGSLGVRGSASCFIGFCVRMANQPVYLPFCLSIHLSLLHHLRYLNLNLKLV